MDEYSLKTHSHNFAAWAAGRAAFRAFAVKDVGETQLAKNLLVECGLDKIESVDQLPAVGKYDEKHKEWRNRMCEMRQKLSHGRAAKIINIYMKTRFICGQNSEHVKIAVIHPPVDSQLLDCLAKINFKGHEKEWRHFHSKKWTKFSSSDYEDVMSLIKKSLGNIPLWKIEKYWNPRGNLA